MLTTEARLNIAETTGLSPDTVEVLALIPKPWRQKVVDMLNLRIAQMRSKYVTSVFDQLRFTMMVSKYEAIRNTLKIKLAPFEKINQGIPWQALTEKSEDIAKLIDYLRGDNGIPGQFKKFIGLNTIDNDSYDNVKHQLEEVSYNLQRAIDGRTYSNQARAAVDSKINDMQRWLNALIMIDGFTSESYSFSARIYATSGNSIYWEYGDLKVNDIVHVIKAGSINSLSNGVHYLYFDSDSPGNLLITDGEDAARTGTNIRIAKITVEMPKLLSINFYGKMGIVI